MGIILGICKCSQKKFYFFNVPLPPTCDAARLHGLRTYFQIQQWKGNPLDPHQWGRKKTQSGLMPLYMIAPPAPQCLLEKISCGCLKRCHKNCSCRKLGLRCSIFCKECAGINCENIDDSVSQEDFDNDINSEIDQCMEKIDINTLYQ